MTDPWLVFDPILPIPVIAFVAIALTILFVWLEWRKNYRYQWLRISAQIILIASLVFLILRPASRTEYAGKDIILLTSNFNKDQADSITKLYPSTKLMRTNGAASYKDAEVISSEYSLRKEFKNLQFVLGDGLSPSTLDEASEPNFTFIQGEKPQGITSLQVSKRPVVNHIVSINGHLNNYKAKQISIESPGGSEDSIQLESGDSVPFELSFVPKQAGQFVYTIILKDQKGSILEQQSLPIEIHKEVKLRILILQNYPTAEIRYLKNFLSQQDNHITLRYQLSRNIFRYEYANVEQTKIDRLDSRLLKTFDVCFIDSDALQKLSAFERSQLIESVRSGLGVVVLFNDKPSQSKSLREVSKAEFISQKNDTAYIRLEKQGLTQLKTLGESIRPYNELQPLIQTSGGKIFSAFSSIGFGKIGFQLTTETYRFIMEGRNDLYSVLWSPLLEKTSRNKPQKFTTRIITPEPIYPNEPVDIEIISTEDQPTLFSDSVRIPLTEDVAIDNRWLGKVWFEKSGWHTLTIPEDSTLTNLYINQADSWKSVRAANQQMKNRLVHPMANKRVSRPEIVYTAISPWIFFVLLLIAGGFLWLAPKL